MKHILIILVILLFATTCRNRTGQEEKKELVPNPGKYIIDGDSKQPDSLKFKFMPDTTIGKVSLINSKKVDAYIGNNVMERLVEKGLLSSSVISSDSIQRLTFYFHPGSVKKEFSEFKVSYVDQKGRDDLVTDEKEFVTESGIRLGMTMKEFRSIKGEPDSLRNGETTILQYRIDDLKNSTFLERYNMPVYYADFEFKNGYLIEFKFGFEYP